MPYDAKTIHHSHMLNILYDQCCRLGQSGVIPLVALAMGSATVMFMHQSTLLLAESGTTMLHQPLEACAGP